MPNRRVTVLGLLASKHALACSQHLTSEFAKIRLSGSIGPKLLRSSLAVKNISAFFADFILKSPPEGHLLNTVFAVLQ